MLFFLWPICFVSLFRFLFYSPRQYSPALDARHSTMPSTWKGVPARERTLFCSPVNLSSACVECQSLSYLFIYLYLMYTQVGLSSLRRAIRMTRTIIDPIIDSKKALNNLDAPNLYIIHIVCTPGSIHVICNCIVFYVCFEHTRRSH